MNALSTSDLAGFTLIALAVVGYVAYTLAPRLTANRAAERLKGVRKSRAALRSNVSRAGARAVSAGFSKLMADIVSSVQGTGAMEDSGLRLALAQGGYRKQSAVIVYLFSRLIAPPIVAILAFLYQTVTSQTASPDYSQMLLVSFGLGLLGFWLPKLLLTNAKTKRQKNILRAFPDMLDLMVICVEAGMSIEVSLNRVADEITDMTTDLIEEIKLTTAELSYIGDRRKALENFARRTDLAQVQAVTTALIQAERYGTSVAQALRVVSREAREERQAYAEQKAASLPAKLTVPMVIFFLPALFGVIMGPAVLSIMELR